jgi:hypothetical protein
MELKFDLDDEVQVKGTDKVGIVKAIKTDIYKLNGKRQEVVKYCVQLGSIVYNDWYQEQHLIPFISYDDFDSKFELGLIDLLIDIYLLDKNNIELIQQLHKEKSQFEVK